MPGVIFENEDDFMSVWKGAEYANSLRNRLTSQPETPIASTSSVVSVRVTGCPDTSGTYGTNVYYPAKFVYRDIRATSETYTDGEDCLVFDLNDGALTVGKRYEGQFHDYANDGKAVIGLNRDPGDGATNVCPTTTRPGCPGACRWTFTGGGWVLTQNNCTTTSTTGTGTTTTGTGTTTSTTTTPGCQCLPPDFCPPPGCAETQTDCVRGQIPAAPNCSTTTTGTGTTTTTSSTTTTTTTTAANCSGCDWLWVPAVGWLLKSINCNGPTCLGVCVPPACGGTGGSDCVSCHTPCLPQPPPCSPSCGGLCQFVCLNDGSWYFLAGGCGWNCLDSGYSCYCDQPTVACTHCGNQVYTPCLIHNSGIGTSTTGTGTTTTTTTTCASNDCKCGHCLWRWSVANNKWVNDSTTCGAGCACASAPPYDGGNNCELAETPCGQPTSTTTTTTTTSCSSCTWRCTGGTWKLIANSCNGSGCDCQFPKDTCLVEGNTISTACCTPGNPACPTTSTTTTSTTTTTTTTLGCNCVYKCLGANWTLINSGCPLNCLDYACVPPALPCTLGNQEQSISSACAPGGTTTTGTTTTTTTTPSCANGNSLYTCTGGTWVLTSNNCAGGGVPSPPIGACSPNGSTTFTCCTAPG